MTNPTTKTIINKIQQRVDREFRQLQQVSNTIDSVVHSLDGDVKDFDAALQGLDELRRVFGDIKNGMQAARGNLLEGQELLNDLVDGTANTTVLVNNLISVFMKSDYSILIQSLMELDPILRQEAFKTITPDLRLMLITELINSD